MSAHEDHVLETQSSRATELAGARSYLLVIDGASSSRFFLPRNGVFLVGRAPDADLRIEGTFVSRRHAKFIVASGEVSVVDLDSHNGVRVNGERIEGSRALASGDVVTIDETTLILRYESRAELRAIADVSKLRERLDDEIERALDHGRPLALLALSLGAEARDSAPKVADACRRTDVVGWIGASQLAVVLPELSGEAARYAGIDLLDAIAPLAPGVKAGLSCLPADGCDVDTLLSAARAAAEIAAPGKLAVASATAIEHTIGERTITLADPAMLRLFDLIRRLAQSDLPVLILGETGAGKENAAAAIHHWSARAGAPFVTLNCATIPETLMESELFGHEKGAFSGAVSSKPGLLECADSGTLFLDEIGELPAGAQAKLLRAIEVKRIARLGSVRDRAVNIRIVAATNRDLETESRFGRFRQDLLFRLSAATVNLPPLRDRPREVPILARRFLAEACTRAGRSPVKLADAALRALASYAWPGNVRELKNAMDYAAATMTGDRVEPWDLPDRVTSSREEAEARQTVGTSAEPAAPAAPAAATVPSDPRRFRPLAEEMRELELTRMKEALEATGGVQTRAAELLGMPVRTFVFKVKQYGLSARETKRRA